MSNISRNGGSEAMGKLTNVTMSQDLNWADLDMANRLDAEEVALYDAVVKTRNRLVELEMLWGQVVTMQRMMKEPD